MFIFHLHFEFVKFSENMKYYMTQIKVTKISLFTVQIVDSRSIARVTTHHDLFGGKQKNYIMKATH